jgi:NhaA family Na+:H+ antiporter
VEDELVQIRFPWSRSDRRLARLVARPLQSFLQAEASSGVLLVIAAVAALVWANSPWSASYDTFWGTELTLRLGPWSVSEDLRHWVNDGLMALFFYVVGLEIKRELLTGELRDRRAAALPVLAAVGGMVVPAAIFLLVNTDPATERGWGIPMATDIAFAVGVVAVLGRRVPSSLRLFLLSLAIVDDIGAIVVIAVVYSGDISTTALAVAAGLVVAILALRRLEVRFVPVYVALGLGVWLATYLSGVHATIAGVVLGFLTPARPFQRPAAVSREAERVADQTQDDPDPPDADAHLWLHLAGLSREVVSPLARAEATLHPWTGNLVVPVFALANAGVVISADSVAAAVGSGLSWAVFLGLVVGKPLGVAGAAWLGTRTRLARLPDGVAWRHLVGAAVVAGIGFTVSLFVAGLAFDDPELQDQATLAVLAASVVAGVSGALALFRAGRSREQAGPVDR